MNYSYFGDYIKGSTNGSVRYIAKSISYCGERNYSARQSIDKISAKARIYVGGILGNSKEDSSTYASYASIGTDWVEGTKGDGYGNHIFQNAGIPDWTPESHDTDSSPQTSPY